MRPGNQGGGVRGTAFGGLVVLLSLIFSAPAQAEEVCDPELSGQSIQLCIDYTMALDPTTAASPVDLDAAITNTSPTIDYEFTWLRAAGLSLDIGEAGPLTLTPSRRLTAGLLLSGGGPCTAPAYSDCGGGGGSLVARFRSACCVPWTETTGNFGIASIVNVNPPGLLNYAKYLLTLRACVNDGGTCYETPDYVQELTVPRTTEGEPGFFSVTLVTANGSQPLSGYPGGAVADYSLRTVNLHIDGESRSVESGPSLPNPETVIAMPPRCGLTNGLGSFLSWGRIVRVHQEYAVTGCPTARLRADASRPRVRFDGSASSTSLAGRSIERWRWDFGDGTPEKVTVAPNVSHRYASGGPKSVGLVVEDSAGALSGESVKEVPVRLPSRTSVRGNRGTSRSRKGDRRIDRVRGRVKPAPGLERVKVVLFGKGRKGFGKVAARRPKLDARGRFVTIFGAPPSARCKVVATYAGNDELRPSSARDRFRC